VGYRAWKWVPGNVPAAGNHVIPLYTPESGVRILSQPANPCIAIRRDLKGGLCRTAEPFRRSVRPHALYGPFDFLELTVLPRNLHWRKFREDAPFEKVCYIDSGHNCIGGVIITAKKWTWPLVWWSSASGGHRV